MAPFVYASSQGQRTHSARTKMLSLTWYSETNCDDLNTWLSKNPIMDSSGQILSRSYIACHNHSCILWKHQQVPRNRNVALQDLKYHFLSWAVLLQAHHFLLTPGWRVLRSWDMSFKMQRTCGQKETVHKWWKRIYKFLQTITSVRTKDSFYSMIMIV